MKQIAARLVLLFIPVMTMPYKVTNSPLSKIKMTIKVKVGTKMLGKLQIGRYKLNPGESRVLDQKEIRKKFEREYLFFEVEEFRAEVPINANLLFFGFRNADGQSIVSAIDLVDNTIYEKESMRRFRNVLKRTPDKLSKFDEIVPQTLLTGR